MKSLTQRQLDRIEEQSDNIQDAIDTQHQRLHGNGAFVGESPLNVFTALEQLMYNAPATKVRQLKKALQRADNALQMASMYAEEIVKWAQDQDENT